MTKNYRNMFNILNNYLNKRLQNVDRTILQAVEDRKNGKKFSFNEHLKGLIFSLLSSQRNWSAIHKNRQYIEKLFFDFDKNKIKNCDYHYFINGLKSRSLGNRAINKQMETLNYNISVLEKIENEYGSLDDFVTRLKPNAISALLACKESPYALKQIGFPLALEYLRNVGIDTVKPDVHIKRIFNRLGLIQENESEEKEVLNVIEKLSKESGYTKAYIDYLLWHYCSEGYGNICSKEPKCNKCVIKEFCEGKMQIIDEIEEFVSSMKKGTIFSTKWFKTSLSKKYKRSEGCYIPSDYCYNRKNKGINYDKQPHFFKYKSRGKYEYVGKNYHFNGKVEENPRIVQ